MNNQLPRSGVCRWDNGDLCWYKCGDPFDLEHEGGMGTPRYDLSYKPALAAYSLAEEQPRYDGVCRTFKGICAELIKQCSGAVLGDLRRHMRERALARLDRRFELELQVRNDILQDKLVDFLVLIDHTGKPEWFDITTCFTEEVPKISTRSACWG